MTAMAVTHLSDAETELRVDGVLVYRGPDEPLELWCGVWYLPSAKRKPKTSETVAA